MNSKNKAIFGFTILLGISIYLVFSGYGERYTVAVWALGVFSGLALSKLLK